MITIDVDAHPRKIRLYCVKNRFGKVDCSASAHPRKIRLYCVKNRFGKVDCSASATMQNRLDKTLQQSHEASVIHISEDGKHVLYQFYPEIKP